MSIGATKESSPATWVCGWFMLLGLAFLTKLALFMIGLYIIYRLLKAGQIGGQEKVQIEERKEAQKFPTSDPRSVSEAYAKLILDNAVQVQLVAESAIPNDIIEDAVSVLYNLGTNKGAARQAVMMAIEDGAITLEKIVTQSLRILNSR